MIPDPTRCCFYEIQEGTQNERVAVGADGNILRWKRDGKPDQQWVIEPWNDQWCRIRTVSNKEFMAVGANGNILRWAETHGPEQLFKFVNPTQDDWWNIQENTQQEYVAVGSTGNILRWAWTGQKDQRFKLIPVDEKSKPFLSGEQTYNPGQIPDIPRIQKLGDPPPDRSSLYLIGQVVVPATLVTDPQYSDRVAQVAANPYYVLRRYQLWDRTQDRGYYFDHDGTTSITEVHTIKVGISETSTKSVESTIGFKLTESGTLGFKLSESLVDISGSFSISQEISQSLKVTTTDTWVTTREETTQDSIQLPAGKRFVEACWSLVDRYELRRADGSNSSNGSILESWEVALPNTQVTDTKSS